jgi:hypothetical protein
MHVTPCNATREGKRFTTRKITIRKAHASVYTNMLTIVLLFSIYKQLQSLSTNKIRNYTYNDMTHNAETSATSAIFFLEGFVLCT